jgi:hypothetical protein
MPALVLAGSGMLLLTGGKGKLAQNSIFDRKKSDSVPAKKED